MGKEIKFTIEMAELKKHILFVRNGLGNSRTDLPVMLLRWEIAGRKASLFAAEKEIFARTEMKITRDSENETDGTFACLGDKIERLIASVESEQVHFTADGENLEIHAGFAVINFELFDGAVVNTVQEGVKEHLTLEGLTVDRSALEEALNCAKSCAVSNSIRADVNHVEMRDGKVLSSDGRKIMIYSHDGFEKSIGLKIPNTALNAVIAAVKNIGVESVQVIEGKAYYYLKAGLNEYTLGVRKVERTFPNMEAAVAGLQSPSDEVTIDKHVLTSMLANVALGLPSDEVRVQIDVTGEGTESALQVSAVNSIGRRSHERAAAGRKAKGNISFPVSVKHLTDTLGVFKGDSTVDLMVLTERNIAVVKDTNNARQVLTVIPFRTESAIADEQKEKQVVADQKKQTKEAAGKDVTDDTETGAVEMATVGAAGGPPDDVEID